MQKQTFGRLASVTLALTLLTAGNALAQSQPDRVIRGPVSTFSETRGGVPGTVTRYADYTYRYVGLATLVNNGLAGIPQQYRDILINLISTSGQNLTEAQINAKIQAVKNWYNANAGKSLGQYNQAGAQAYPLALILSEGLTGPTVTFYDNQWGSQHRGWPLQAAMIHAGEYAAHTAVNQSALLAAWDMVMGNQNNRTLSDPLVLDLNGNGKIDVTGASSSKWRATKHNFFVKEGSVVFDIRGNGNAIRTEWVKSGDGFLVDNRKNQALDLIAKGKNLTVFNLLGDTEGNATGFAKLARFFDAESQIASNQGNVRAPGLGIIKGAELDDLLVWIDNGDGKAEKKEMHTLASLGITEIRLPSQIVKSSEEGEIYEQAVFIRNGKSTMMQEVWFADEQ